MTRAWPHVASWPKAAFSTVQRFVWNWSKSGHGSEYDRTLADVERPSSRRCVKGPSELYWRHVWKSDLKQPAL